MPGPAESRSVSGATAALNQIFETAAAMLERIKSNRPADSSLLLFRPLEDCLETAPQAIEEQRERGAQWFGPAFDIGDDIAVNELIKICAELSNTVIETLATALSDDSFTDFPSLEKMAEDIRAQALLALGQLYMRLTEERRRKLSMGSPVSELPSPGAREEPGMLPTSDYFAKRHSSPEPMLGPPSYFPQFKFADIKTPFDRGKQKIAATKDWGSRAARRLLSTSHSERSSTHSSRTADSRSRDSSLISSALQDLASQSEDEDVHPAMRMHPGDKIDLTKLISRIVTPCPDNNYLGFCRGAYELYQGRKQAFRKERDMSVSFSNSSYLMCAHCPFRCDIPQWKVYSGYGVQFRWDLLAKSHVPQTRIRERKNLIYQCMFCAFTGGEPALIQGDELFLLHIAGHRGTEYSDAILNMTKCINDRVADDSEDFDVNLVPLPIEHDAYELPSHDV